MRLGKRSNMTQSVFRSLFYVSYKNEHVFYSEICTCYDLRKKKKNEIMIHSSNEKSDVTRKIDFFKKSMQS